MFIKNLFKTWNKISLVKQIIIGLLIGIILALTVPEQVSGITILGDLFVGALKAVAPILVFFLVMSAISGHKSGQKTNMKSIIILYLDGHLCCRMCSSNCQLYFQDKSDSWWKVPAISLRLAELQKF